MKVLPENKRSNFEIEDNTQAPAAVSSTDAQNHQPGNHAHRMLLVFGTLPTASSANAQTLASEISHRIETVCRLWSG